MQSKSKNKISLPQIYPVFFDKYSWPHYFTKIKQSPYLEPNYQNELHFKEKLRLIAEPVIEAIVRLEFEDGLRTGVFLGGCWGP